MVSVTAYKPSQTCTKSEMITPTLISRGNRDFKAIILKENRQEVYFSLFQAYLLEAHFIS